MKQTGIFLIVMAIMGFNSIVNGHFIWVAKSNESGAVHVYFGEGPHPDKAQFLLGLKDIKGWSIDADNAASPIQFEKRIEGENGWLEAKTGNGQPAIDIDCRYGVFSRGDNKMMLHYGAKYVDLQTMRKSRSSGELPLDVSLNAQDNATVVRVTFEGRPAVDCELEVVTGTNQPLHFKTDRDGQVKIEQSPQPEWLLTAKKVVNESGVSEGNPYDEIRYYCTMTLAPHGASSIADHSNRQDKMDNAGTVTSQTPSSFPALPVGITSFGGAVCDDHLYVFGGHCGDAHDYYKSGQNGVLYRLNLRSPEAWEAVNESDGLQGLAMVQHDGKLYRVGGFQARNEQGAKQDLHSVAEFAQFDFQQNQWVPLTPMPSPRSSLDAVVFGDTLYVVGGWNLQGKDETVWHDYALSIDLNDPNASWQKIPMPFKRRALSVGYQEDKLYVVGGMQEKGGPTRKVGVYDTQQKTWSDGPELPDGGTMEGFGSSCFNIGGNLVVSTYSGKVFKLADSGDEWKKIDQLETGRFFHRLLPFSRDRFVIVGGANMDIGKLQNISVMKVE